MQMFNSVLNALSLRKPEGDVPASPEVSTSSGYDLHGLTYDPYTFDGSLTLAGKPANTYGQDIKELDLRVKYQSRTRLHVHISDTAKKQFQVPEATLPRPAFRKGGTLDLRFNFVNKPFAFFITRRTSDEILFDTRSSPLVFSDQYLQLSTTLPASSSVYGPGEIVSSHGFKRSNKKDRTTLWNRDAGTPVDENIYGSHPFYVCTTKEGSFGVFLLNSHGMEMITKDDVLTYNVLGGTLDFYFFSGPTAMDVVRQYSEVVGKPARVPFWAFGLHMCRWNGDWRTPEDVKEVVKKMRDADIPLETVWSDLDYMDRFRDFESNEKWNHKKYSEFVAWLHENKQHYIPIVDAGIAKPKKGDSYDAYDRGKELDVFVKGDDGEEYVGWVWPGDAVYPDWTAKHTQKWWQDCFDQYRKTAKYDGIWLDMNEPSNFHMGKDRPKGDLKDQYNTPPYKISNGYEYFWDKTICPNAKLADGYRHYHEHNLFGHEQNLATHKVLLEQRPDKRPFIITRSTFAGTGRVSGHWLGDNYSSWESMRHSIQGVLQFQLFQIPMVGADACGFGDNCTEELADRWMQLAAFTPFYRNHNAEGCKDQEPYRWKSVTEASKSVLRTRYQLLPYWETLFTQASIDGTPPIRPLCFEFPEPELAGVDEQFMIGPHLLITPVLYEGSNEVKGYFPKAAGVWRDWYTYKSVDVDSESKATLPTLLGSINVHIRPGSIILIHSEPAYNLTDTKKSEYGLIISLDDKGEASGIAILDDGLSIDGFKTTVKFSRAAQESALVIDAEGCYKDAPTLTKVTILGVGGKEEVKVFDVRVSLSSSGRIEL